MASGLANLRRASAEKPPRILIYGEPGSAKTSLASEFPNSVFIQTEDGTPGDAEITTMGEPETFGELMDCISELYTAEHDFEWLILDSVTSAQKLVFAETCARGDDKGNPKAQIEDFGYGKGYVYCQRVWQELLDGLKALRNDRGMGIVLIAHSRCERFDDPETVSYDRYEIDLHAKSVGMIERDVDAILLLAKPVSVKQEEQGFNQKRNIGHGAADRIEIRAVGKPAYVAKNRYGIPERLDFKRGHGFEVLAPYFPARPAAMKEAAE